MKCAPLIILAFLVGCAAPSPETSRSTGPVLTLPAMKTFSTANPTRPQTSNTQIAREYLELVFRLESGDRVPNFSRFEAPITVRVDGTAPPTLGPDLDRLLARMRREAGLDIKRVPSSDTAAISIVPVRRAQIRRAAPTAACFVRPNISSWDEYRARRNDPETFWTNLTKRERMAVFLPSDVSPQEMRDCLHEEIAQALGPVNDIFRLGDSVFNDDNFHTVLTGYDMLILAVHYDEALRPGMNEAQVAAALPGILARLNPRGGRGGLAPPRPDNGRWKTAITQATDTRLSRTRRASAADRAVGLAFENAQTNDLRLALSYYMQGRLTLGRDPEKALRSFLLAGAIYKARPETRIQQAHVDLQIAAFQLAAGRAEDAQRTIDANLSAVRRAEHASLLSLMLLLKAETFRLQDKDAEADRLQQDALGYARYGFGNSDIVRERASEIFAISPRNRPNQGDRPT